MCPCLLADECDMAFKTLYNQCTLVEGLGQAIKNLTLALCRNIEATMEVMRLIRRQVGGAGQFGGLKLSSGQVTMQLASNRRDL